VRGAWILHRALVLFRGAMPPGLRERPRSGSRAHICGRTHMVYELALAVCVCLAICAQHAKGAVQQSLRVCIPHMRARKGGSPP
jgi:hypothetical protein